MSGGELLLALLSAAVKAGLLLGFAAGLARLLRRAPARARHGIWAGALAGALLVPVLSPWLPAWSIAALPVPSLAGPPAWWPTQGAALGLELGRELGLEALAEMLPADRSALAIEPGEASAGNDPAGQAPRSADPRTSNDGAAPTRPMAADRPASRSGATAVAPTSAILARLRTVSPAVWVLALWLAGCLACAAALLRSLLAARGLERGAVAPGRRWRNALAEARRQVGVRRHVRLLHSPAVATPMTWGLRRPVILLPAGAASWSAERRRIVLLHELVHIRRADWVVRLLARLVCVVYWPNPLAWAAARRLAAEQEMACDEEVVALGTRPSSYARHLLAIARSLAPGAVAAPRAPAHALDMARRSQMEGRLMSILDGNRRTRGGRRLAILALLILAGLVPALAAIEPWVEDQEVSAPLSSNDPPPATVPAADTEGVARVLGELQKLETQMRPFEAELEGVERQMEPIVREIEGIEAEIEPVEGELAGFESQLEPYQAQLAAVEAEMEPTHARLAEIEAEIKPFEAQLREIEAEMAPFEEQLRVLEAEMAPHRRRLEELGAEMEPVRQQLERTAEQMELAVRQPGSGQAEQLEALMGEMQESLEPLQERIGAANQEMEPLYERMSEIHRQMEPLHERVGAIHEQMEPVYERMAAAHQELEPLHERMGAIHEQMEPVHEQMSGVHERMAPIHERLGERHERLEPHHLEMAEIHARMQPLHEEMGRRHEELERELEGLVERLLARELGGVTAPDTDYAPAAARIVDDVSLRVDDGTLRVMSSAPRLRAILAETLGARSVASDEAMAAAVERVVRAIAELEIEAR